MQTFYLSAPMSIRCCDLGQNKEFVRTPCCIKFATKIPSQRLFIFLKSVTPYFTTLH